MAIVGELNLFGLKIDMGSLFSKYQGETDQNIRTVQEIIRSAAPVYALFDEFEKQFAGAGGSGDLDSGTTKRATGGWLDFFQNRPPGVYISGTANSFEGIPSPYLRPGRWDTTPFFVDLPSEKVRSKILKHYCEKTDPKLLNGKVPDMKDFTGAEVEALVNLADMRGKTLVEARDFIIPQIITKGEEITELRNWAKGRCLSAEDFKPIKANGKRRLDV
jgi:SpoVK/Ycf46/Vps4 family AAA+-type ATPase